MNKKNIHFVLAVYPNSRGVGYAVFHSANQPVDCGMIQIPKIDNEKCIKVIQDLVKRHKATLLISRGISKTDGRFKRIRVLNLMIQKFAKKDAIQLMLYTREDVRFVFENFGATTKEQINKTIVRWIPELKPKTPKPRKLWQAEMYFQGMFDAYALALSYYYKH